MKGKSPQEKKALSYAKDHRGVFGHNDKAARRLIPLRKAQANRSYRRKANEALDALIDQGSDSADSLQTTSRSVKGERWRKVADRLLGEITREKLERRETYAGKGKAARKKANKFLRTLKIETMQEPKGNWKAVVVGMNSVLGSGDTEEAAVKACRSLARAVYLEKLGALTILDATGRFISVLSG